MIKWAEYTFCFCAVFSLTGKKGRVTLCLLVTNVLPADIFVKPLSEYNFTYITYHKIG